MTDNAVINSHNEGADRGYTITRTFDAPRELVWQAWTDPKQFAVWFGGSTTEMRDVTMDVRPGGAWSGTMLLPDGAAIAWRGSFVDVQPPQRLVLTLTDQTILGTEFETMTVTLTDLGGTTELVLRQSGGHLSDEQYAAAMHGTGGFLDAMADLLAGRQPS
jgi:uncharacterized protein YndB with AHSA1/START domain